MLAHERLHARNQDKPGEEEAIAAQESPGAHAGGSGMRNTRRASGEASCSGRYQRASTSLREEVRMRAREGREVLGRARRHALGDQRQEGDGHGEVEGLAACRRAA